MNTAKKSCKIILFLTALVMFVAAALCGLHSNVVLADNGTIPANPENYFSGVQTDIVENKMVATVKSGDTLKVKNELVVDDFAIDVDLPESVNKLTVGFESDSYYVNGNKTVDGENVTFEKKVVNKVVLTKNADKYDAEINGISAGQLDDSIVAVSVEDGFMYLNEVKGDVDGSVAKRIRHGEYSTAYVTLSFELTGVDTAEIILNSIDQKNSDATGEYKQSFVTVDGKFSVAKPIIAIDAPLKVKGNVIKAFVSTEYDFAFDAYSVLGNVTRSDLAIVDKGNNVYLTNTVSKPKTAVFQEVGNAQISIGVSKDVVYKTYTVEVLEKDADTKAPVYVDDAFAVESFEAALEKACYTTNSNGDKTNIALGTDIKIPSMEDLVLDDITPYEKLTYTVHYATPESKSTTSSLKFRLTTDGEYYFYVAFKDINGNSMESGMFIEDKDDEIDVIYGGYVFTFNIVDDADISVKAPVKPGTGYKGVAYTASKFIIDAEGCSTAYKLYYTSDTTVTDNSVWVEIPKASSITDTKYKEDYTYEEVQSIAYNGELTFTPNKIGNYKIECTATSEVSSRSATASALISVVNEPQIVKPANNWLKDNIWSVVFLSVGTLCLAGIIVLLCIKPKEDADNDEE